MANKGAKITSQISSPSYQFEQEWAVHGPVIGIDEAGRGPWAGPVTAAAFWIFPDGLDRLPPGLTDSKKLTARQRADIKPVCAVRMKGIFMLSITAR